MDVRIYGSNDCENRSGEEPCDWAVLWRFGGDSKASASDSAAPSSTASENCIGVIDSSAAEVALDGRQRESCSGFSSSEARSSKRSCGTAAAEFWQTAATAAQATYRWHPEDLRW
jgi:hypothetical protein